MVLIYEAYKAYLYADISTTQIYTASRPERLAGLVTSAHPLASRVKTDKLSPTKKRAQMRHFLDFEKPIASLEGKLKNCAI